MKNIDLITPRIVEMVVDQEDEMIMLIAEWESGTKPHYEFSIRFKPKIIASPLGGRQIIHTYKLVVRDDSVSTSSYTEFTIDPAIIESALDKGDSTICAAIASMSGEQEEKFNLCAPQFFAVYENDVMNAALNGASGTIKADAFKDAI